MYALGREIGTAGPLPRSRNEDARVRSGAGPLR